MPPKRDFDGVAVYGDRRLSEKRTLAWKICNFASLPHKSGEWIADIGTLRCHGYTWRIVLYPRGVQASSEGHECVSIFLERLEKDADFFAAYTFSVGQHSVIRPEARFRKGDPGRGFMDFMKREDALTSLDNGALLIEVDIQISLDTKQPLRPKSALSRNMLKMLESEEWADVTFVVEDQMIRAHYGVLVANAPTFFEELAPEVGAKPSKEIAIDGVDASLFKAVLRFVYAEECPPNEMLEQNAREFLCAADRFGCTNLKLIAESKLVESGIDDETAAELLLLADARNCALLKEAALDYIKANTAAVMDTAGWNDVRKSAALMSEVMEASFKRKLHASDDSDIDQMTVADLRHNLQEEGLSEDGTREMLVKRLKEASSAKKCRTET